MKVHLLYVKNFPKARMLKNATSEMMQSALLQKSFALEFPLVSSVFSKIGLVSF
jgi:hypothetical protein